MKIICYIVKKKKKIIIKYLIRLSIVNLNLKCYYHILIFLSYCIKKCKRYNYKTLLGDVLHVLQEQIGYLKLSEI